MGSVGILEGSVAGQWEVFKDRWEFTGGQWEILRGRWKVMGVWKITE